MSLTPADAATLRQALATVVVVPVTPLHADGRPDWDTYAALTRRLIDGGITVITPNGNTGEFYALSHAEARQALETAARASSNRASSNRASSNRAELLAGVGHDIVTAVESARHAADHGARMIMIHQPVHPYVSREGWIDRFTWLAGAAELTAPGYWVYGAHGFTSGLANVTPELPLAMLDALRANDFGQAMKVWEKARRFEELRAADASADNVSVVKEALAQLGLCRADVRPPSRPLPPHITDEIAGILAGWGLT
jgi:4-hydroxy-tetrahydrodipicolinate synthase